MQSHEFVGQDPNNTKSYKVFPTREASGFTPLQGEVMQFNTWADYLNFKKARDEFAAAMDDTQKESQ